MSRIRYEKLDPQRPYLRRSVQRFRHPKNGALYKEQLNLKDGEWLILDEVSGLIAASGLKKHIHKLKIDVRDTLEQLGIKLEVDERKKRKVKAQ